MPKASPIQTNFTAGEFAPTLEGRVDIAKYANACRRMRNMFPLLHGPAVRRGGTRHVAAAKSAAMPCRLIPFEFSVAQAYVLEFGDGSLRVYRDHGQVEASPGVPVEVATPYGAADLARLRFAQSADVLYLVHPAHPPRTLSRTSHVDWTLADYAFKDGPYLPQNIGAVTLTPAAASGAGVTLTASAALFAASDVGRLLRWRGSASANWGWARIAAYAGATQVSVDWQQAAGGGAAASTHWRLGAWSATTGWPAVCTFFQDRLCFAGATGTPQRIDMSRSGDYESFTPSEPDGTVVDDHAVAITLNANDVNVVRWLADDEKGLIAGTVGGEWLIRPSSLGEALTPANVQASRSTNFGSADVAPERIGKAILYVQRARRRLREHAFVFEDDGFRSPDVSLLATHLAEPGIVEMAFQQEPDSVLWLVRDDGRLLGLSYAREQDVVAWHLHTLGGWSDAARTQPAAVESVACIPAPDGARDELWLAVRRRIDGATVRTIERMEATLGDGAEAADAYYVDAGLSYQGAPATAIAGLDHLEGETVAVLADGATHPDRIVVGGAIALERAASTVHVGLGFVSLLETLNLEAGSATGTAQGKIKRLHRCVIHCHRTLGLEAGAADDALDPVPQARFRPPSAPMGAPPALFSGDADIAWPGGYETGGRVVVACRDPLPATIVAIMPQLVTQDR
ncbi:MAG: hypothetical protein R3F55_00240 [Alphaproteobacteria bacterium]